MSRDGFWLIVMRHAKAGELPGGPDAERELRPRGLRDARAAGEWLRGRGILPDLVICSAARRARQTWQQVAVGLRAGVTELTDARLYHADAAELLDIIAETEPPVSTLMYVGHNPAAADLVSALTGRDLDFPTSAIAVVALPASFAEAAGGGGELVASWVPGVSRSR